MMSARCSLGRTAAPRWMPRSALPRMTAPGSFRNRARLLRYCARAPITPARRTPARDEAPEPASDWGLVAQPEPELEFDQRIAWESPSPAGGGAESMRLAAVSHDPEPAPAPRFGLQRASRDVDPSCFRTLTSDRGSTISLPQRQARPSGPLEFPIRIRRGTGSRSSAEMKPLPAQSTNLSSRTGDNSSSARRLKPQRSVPKLGAGARSSAVSQLA
jgi:hypothetical protein